MNNKEVYTYIDLFSGPGGLCTGFKNAGFKPLIAVEISDWTVKTYARNHNAEILELNTAIQNIGRLENILSSDDRTVLIHGDIREVSNELIMEILNKKFNMNTVDVVAGGPPCESFSMAGNRCEEDERNDLFHNLLRIGHNLDAKFIFFENVPGLLTKKKDGKVGKQFEYIIEEFEKLNKETGTRFTLKSKDKKEIKLLAADFGVPQNRERVFLIANNSKFKENTFEYPKATHGLGRKYPHITVKEALYNLPVLNSGEGEDLLVNESTFQKDFKEGDISESHYNFMKFMKGMDSYLPNHISYNSNVITMHKALNHRKKMIKRFENIQQGEGMKKAAERLINGGREDLVKEYFPNKLYAARNRRLEENKPSFTVTSHCLDEMIHPYQHRQLTPREVARLQSFPDWYLMEGPYVKFHSDPEQDKYEQIGDAIPVLLVKALAQELYKAIERLELK
ncbi:DNA cytosine methyltransferase [Clostridium botulinum]|uniref:Cytosine-specific methyltransferase n=1 Tax=Clostridium botulinum TaxID=1491 RepID=A0A6B4G2P4_CLOBO|nr:DNA cytosine methyltransferase [Clostridium botulinum]MBN3382927.1 restriction endonuclease [Clostridium botulinum]NFF90081.1 DNA cytosine methyltransferase [Clostridium botulinum]NFG16867.1 DNA cytosine methyltransferase [Clostridium botulinum]NFG30632.1 DNA cytosine methyltransferase [Clostridium botulinum]NFG33775.1 DNA cytosine methyltransferase [Clostridium botulinum]